MHYVLIALEEPKDAPLHIRTAWTNLIKYLSDTKSKDKPVRLLAENVIVIPLNTCMTEFCEIGHQADYAKIGYTCLFFAEAPEWVRSQFSEEL